MICIINLTCSIDHVTIFSNDDNIIKLVYKIIQTYSISFITNVTIFRTRMWAAVIETLVE